MQDGCPIRVTTTNTALSWCASLRNLVTQIESGELEAEGHTFFQGLAQGGQQPAARGYASSMIVSVMWS